jgi:hypothetical protein
MSLNPEQILDKLQYWEGYLRGCSTILRSAGTVDPLALSGDFEDCSRDMAVIRQSLVDVFFSDDEEDTEEKT